MITVLSPIFIGLVIWLVTVVAERRLKVYDQTMNEFRDSTETKANRLRSELKEDVQQWRVENATTLQQYEDRQRTFREDTRSQADGLRGELTDGIEQARKTITETIEGRIQGQVRDAVETQRLRMDSVVGEYQEELKNATSAVEDIRRQIEDRFGHIADSAGYARNDANFGELTSVGAVRKHVASLFEKKDRAQAVTMVREMLNLFHTRDASTRPAGSLEDDWFNLSVVLGRADEERLALEVCLAGLEQEAGEPLFQPDGRVSPGMWGRTFNEDVMAHAIQYAQTVGDRRVGDLIRLNGYDAETRRGRPSWGWRSYGFTIKALASLGRQDEAIDLGHAFMAEKPVDGDTNKVVSDLITVMAQVGQKQEATELAVDWLDANPYAPGPQIIVHLLDWMETTEDVDGYIALATRGIRDLAEEQASTNHGNFYYRRALARDKRVLDRAMDAARYDLDFCAEIEKALADYKSAKETDAIPNIRDQIALREKVLRRTAADIGCDLSPDSEAETHSEDAATEDMAEAIRKNLVKMLPILTDKKQSPEARAAKIAELLQGMDPMEAQLTLAQLDHMKDDDDAPDALRKLIHEIWPHLETSS